MKNLKPLIMSIIISILLTLIMPKLKSVKVGKLQVVLGKWAEVQQAIDDAIQDAEVKLAEAGNIHEKMKAALTAVLDLFKQP